MSDRQEEINASHSVSRQVSDQVKKAGDDMVESLKRRRVRAENQSRLMAVSAWMRERFSSMGDSVRSVSAQVSESTSRALQAAFAVMTLNSDRDKKMDRRKGEKVEDVIDASTPPPVKVEPSANQKPEASSLKSRKRRASDSILNEIADNPSMIVGGAGRISALRLDDPGLPDSPGASFSRPLSTATLLSRANASRNQPDPVGPSSAHDPIVIPGVVTWKQVRSSTPLTPDAPSIPSAPSVPSAPRSTSP